MTISTGKRVRKVLFKKVNLLSIINQNERYEIDEKKLGILLGQYDKNENVLRVQACFPITLMDDAYAEMENGDDVHDSSAITPSYQLNNELLNQLYMMHLRINPNHVILGWYYIGNDLEEDAVKTVHRQIQEETMGFDAICLHVDMDLLQVASEFPLDFSIAVDACLPGTTNPEDRDLLFLPVAHELVGESSVFRDGSSLTKENSSNLHSLANVLQSIKSQVALLQDYVSSSDASCNLEIAQTISDALALVDTCSIPITPDAFGKVLQDRHWKDLEMVDRLASVCKRLLNAASNLQSSVGTV